MFSKKAAGHSSGQPGRDACDRGASLPLIGAPLPPVNPRIQAGDGVTPCRLQLGRGKIGGRLCCAKKAGGFCFGGAQRRKRASSVTSPSDTVVRMVDAHTRVSPAERICTIDNTDAKMDTMPNRVMMLTTASLRACSMAS